MTDIRDRITRVWSGIRRELAGVAHRSSRWPIGLLADTQDLVNSAARRVIVWADRGGVINDDEHLYHTLIAAIRTTCTDKFRESQRLVRTGVIAELHDNIVDDRAADPSDIAEPSAVIRRVEMIEPDPINRQIMELKAADMTSPQIAVRLGIGTNAVDQRICGLRRKIGIEYDRETITQ